jgi:hypothetical protein
MTQVQAYTAAKRGFIVLLLAAFALPGCATNSDTKAEGAFVDSIIAPIPYDEAWLMMRDVLLDKELEIHTRDKRGLFVVYTDMKRRALVVPHRTKLTIRLTSETDDSTRIAVESVHQKYGVSLLTHPEWRDQTTTPSEKTSIEILNTIKSLIKRNS